MNNVLFSLALITIVASCNKKNQNAKNASVDTAQLYYNGNILTMQSDTPVYVEALVAQDGKIAFIGTLKDAEKQFSIFTCKEILNNFQ